MNDRTLNLIGLDREIVHTCEIPVSSKVGSDKRSYISWRGRIFQGNNRTHRTDISINCHEIDFVKLDDGEIERLKCCGNCERWEIDTERSPYFMDADNVDCEHGDPSHKCDQWEHRK